MSQVKGIRKGGVRGKGGGQGRGQRLGRGGGGRRGGNWGREGDGGRVVGWGWGGGRGRGASHCSLTLVERKWGGVVPALLGGSTGRIPRG